MKEATITHEDIDRRKTRAQDKREALLSEQASLLSRINATKNVRATFTHDGEWAPLKETKLHFSYVFL